LPLPEEFYNRSKSRNSRISPTYSGLYPTFGEEEEEDDGFSLLDTLGSGLHHFVSAGTMGLSEFAAPTKAWEEKGTDERIGAALGEALGMFLPMGWIGKGVSVGMQGLRHGSRHIAKKAIAKSTNKINNIAAKNAANQSLNKTVFSKEGKRLLFQHELGGEVAQQVNSQLVLKVEADLMSALSKKGVNITKDYKKKVIDKVMKDFKEGLADGEHLNTVSSWMHKKIGPTLGTSGLGKWTAKYMGEVAQDAVILGLHGVVHNTMMSAARDDVPFAPGSTLGHSLAMSFAFPLIRSIPGGGERRFDEGWRILTKNLKKTDYKKLAKESNGPEDLRSLVRMLGKNNILSKNKWTLKSGKQIHLDELADDAFLKKEGLDDLIDLAEQMRDSVTKMDMFKVWGKSYVADTFNLGTISRMSIGAAAMNIDMFRHNMAGFRSLPPEELLTHMLIGGFMTRGRGGWARDPQSRTGDQKAKEINEYYALMNELSIDHSKVSDYLKVKDMADYLKQTHIGILMDPTAVEIVDIFKKYEKRIIDEGRTVDKSKQFEINDILYDFSLLRQAAGVMEDTGYGAPNYKLLTESEKTNLRNDLRNVKFKDKTLKDTSYSELMNYIEGNQKDAIKELYTTFLKRLRRESQDGAGDQILDLSIDANGIIRHGGVNFGSEYSSPGELHNLLKVFEKYNLAIHDSSKKEIDLSDVNSSQSRRLERVLPEFKKTQNRLGLGEGAEYSFSLGNPQENPYLRNMVNAFLYESQKRNSDIFTNQITPEFRNDKGFLDVIRRELTDGGKAIRPENVTIKVEEGVEIDPLIHNQFHGIVQAIHSGAKSFSGKTSHEVPLEIAQRIIGAYESLKIGKPEALLDRNVLNYISSQADAKINISPHIHRTIRRLDEHGLVHIDREQGMILVNSETSIKLIAKEAGIDSNKAWERYRDLLELLPSRQIVEQEGPLDFADKAVEITALKNIHKTLPEVYNKEVRNEITKVLDNKTLQFDEFTEKNALEQLDLLEANLKSMNYKEALITLENLKKIVPGFDSKKVPSEIRYDKVADAYRIYIYGRELGHIAVADVNWSPASRFTIAKDKAYDMAQKKAKEFMDNLPADMAPQTHYESLFNTITAAEKSGMGLSLQVYEYSKGSGQVYDAIKNLVHESRSSSELIENYLGHIIYKGNNYKFAAINDHSRLVDNLNTLLRNTNQKVSLNELFKVYIQDNTLKSLNDLMTGLNQLYAGRNSVNLLDSQNLMNAYHRFMNNATDRPSKTRITIGNKYGLLDAENGLHPRVIEHLKRGDFDAIKKRIPADKLGSELDSDLLNLAWIVNNAKERRAISFTEKIIDGEVYRIREWINPVDNPEFITPGGRVLDKLNEVGIELVQIKKSGVINRRFINDISQIENVKDLFQQTNLDMPSDKYINDVIRKGGELSPRDEANARLVMGNPTGRTMRYVEVSFGAPLAFLETKKSTAALNKAYHSFYVNTLKRYNNEMKTGLIAPDEGHMLIKNFKRVFDPSNVTSPELKIRALYLANLNSATFDKSFSSKAISDMTTEKGHYDINMSLLKYTKLAEGGSLKAIPDRQTLTDVMLKLATAPDSTIPKRRLNSIENIINDLTPTSEGGTGKGIRYGFISDEAGGNPLLVRNRALIQHTSESNISDPVLRKYSKDRYSDLERFKATMDQSSIDGAIYIDRDTYNLMRTLMAEGGDVNGFKGSIARGHIDDSGYVLFGKGLFIFDPQVSNAMESKGIRFLMGNSAAKDKKGFALNAKPVEGKVFESTDFIREIDKMGDSNIMQGTFDGVGLRFAGHVSANSPVPHPYTHFMPRDLVIGIREGWMGLSNKIDELKSFSNSLKDVAKSEVQEMLVRQANLHGPSHQMDMPSFAESMIAMGFNTRNEVVKKAVMKMFEEQTLPTLFKPKNPKFAYPLLMPDYKSLQPLSVDIVNRNGERKGAARIQLGEATIGADAKYTPVNSVNELIFSMRVGDVDYIVKHDSGKFQAYTALRDIQKSGKYNTDIKSDVLKQLPRNKDVQVPIELQKFVKYLDKVIQGDPSIPRHEIHTTVDGQTGKVSFEGVQRLIESSYYNKKFKLDKHKFGTVIMVERGPRKGRSDFIPARVRVRTEGEKLIDYDKIGTLFGLNPYDARANAQADWDGDKVRYTFDFKNVGKDASKWKMLKQAFRESSMNEEYTTLETPIRETNIWGIGTDKNGDLTHMGARDYDSMSGIKRSVINERMAIGKVIGVQSGLEYASLIELSIDGQKLNEKLGFSVDHIMEYGNMYKRFDKASQSAVDFIKGINKTLLSDPYGYYFYGDGESQLKGKLFNFEAGDVRRDVFNEVVDVLRRPSSIFNKVWSDGGSQNPTSFHVQSEYVNLLKFFKSPNSYVFNRLVKKYQRTGNLNEKLNSLIPLFFKVEGKDIMPRDIDGLKSLALQGKLKPRNNVLQFGKGTAESLLKRSNVGFIMSEVIKSNIYKVGEIDYAWSDQSGKGIRDLRKLKLDSEIFVDQLSLYRVLGVDIKDMHANHDIMFSGSKKKFITQQENAGIMHALLSEEVRFLENKLETQYGFRNPNQAVTGRATQRLLDVNHAMKYLEEVRGLQVLEDIKPTISKYKFNFKGSRHYNKTSKEQTIYKIKNNMSLYTKDADGVSVPNFNALEYVGIVGRNKRSEKTLHGEHLILNNPIISHRLSKDRTLDGYTWHYMHNNVPAFTDKVSFQNYSKEALGLQMKLSKLWSNSIDALKTNRDLTTDIFEKVHRDRAMLLNEFFKTYSGTEPVDAKFIIPGFDAQESLIYYKTKMLLKPHLVARQYVKTDNFDLPYLKTNQKVFENTMSWLHDNGYGHIGKKIASEYNNIKDYLTGMSNDRTFDLKASPLYLEKYTIPDGVHKETFLNIMQGIVTPDLQYKFQSIGASTYEIEKQRTQEGDFSIRQIRNQFEKWNEYSYDRRKQNLCGGG